MRATKRFASSPSAALRFEKSRDVRTTMNTYAQIVAKRLDHVIGRNSDVRPIAEDLPQYRRQNAANSGNLIQVAF